MIAWLARSAIGAGIRIAKPEPSVGPPSAWIEIAASLWARLPIAARSVMHGPTPVLLSRVITTRAPAASSRARSRTATLQLKSVSRYPSGAAVPGRVAFLLAVAVVDQP